jgi:hypothetical protein
MTRGGNAPRPRWSLRSARHHPGKTVLWAGGVSTVLVLMLLLFRSGRVPVVIVGVVCVISVYLLMHGRLDRLVGKKGARQ